MSTNTGYLGAVYMQTGSATTFTTEACTRVTATRYQITATAKRYWDKATTPSVFVDAAPVTNVSFEYLGGYIVFTEDPGIGTAVTVTGKYYTVSQVAGFFDWSLEMSADMLEVTDLGDADREYVPGLLSYSCTANWFWGDSTFFENLSDNVIVVCYVDATKRYEFFARSSGVSTDTPVDETIKEQITFTGNAEIYYRST